MFHVKHSVNNLLFISIFKENKNFNYYFLSDSSDVSRGTLLANCLESIIFFKVSL